MFNNIFRHYPLHLRIISLPGSKMKWFRAVWEKMQEPLKVSTNIEYELDMRLFPGLDDVNCRSQPSLMIHKPEVLCHCPAESSKHDERCTPDIDLLCHEVDTFLDYNDGSNSSIISAPLTTNPEVEEKDLLQLLNDAFTIECDASESQLCDIPDFLNTPPCLPNPNLLCDKYSKNNNTVQFHHYINDQSNDPYISGFEKPCPLPPPQNRLPHQTTSVFTPSMDNSLEPPVSRYHNTTLRTEDQFRNDLPAIILVKDPNYTSQHANPYLQRTMNVADDHFHPSAIRPVTKECQPRSIYYESNPRMTEISRYSTNVASSRWLGAQLTSKIEQKPQTSLCNPINGASHRYRMANGGVSTTKTSHVPESTDSRSILPERVTSNVNTKTTESSLSHVLTSKTTGSHGPTETVISSFQISKNHLHSAGDTVTAAGISNLNTLFAKKHDAAAKQTCDLNVLTSVKESTIDIAKPEKRSVKATFERKQPAATGTLDNQRCADTLQDLRSSSPLVQKTETVKRHRTPRSKKLVVDMKFVTPKQRTRSLKRNGTADNHLNTAPVQDSVKQNKERTEPSEKTTASNDCFKTTTKSSHVSARQKFKPSCFCEFYPSEVKVKSSPSKKPGTVHYAMDSNKKRAKLHESPETGVGNMKSRKRKITTLNDANSTKMKLRSVSHRDLVFMELDSFTKRRYDGSVPDQELVMY